MNDLVTKFRGVSTLVAIFSGWYMSSSQILGGLGFAAFGREIEGPPRGVSWSPSQEQGLAHIWQIYTWVSLQIHTWVIVEM